MSSSPCSSAATGDTGGPASVSSITSTHPPPPPSLQQQQPPPLPYGFPQGEISDKTLAISDKTLVIEDFPASMWNPTADGSKSLPHAGMDSHATLSLLQAVSGKSGEDMWEQIQTVTKQPQQNTSDQAGELTLEDLLKTGVVKEDMDAKVDLSLYAGNSNFHPGAFVQATDPSIDWMMNTLSSQQQLIQQPAGTSRGGTILMPHDGNTGSVSGPNAAAGLPLVSSFSECSILSRKRGTSPVVESSVQRRQKRMIKNRESAARSRARRQAYTVELEAEVSHLKAENARLKKIQALENAWRKTVYKQESSARTLRRTRSW